MKKYFSIVFLLLIISLSFMISGCEGKNKNLEGWTIFVYMCGSNLETKNSAATKNMQEMIANDIPDNINIVIEAGGAKEWHTDGIEKDDINRLVINNKKISRVDKTKQANMGSSDTLKEFLSWGIKKYPAKKYGLIFWDHGNGCLGGVCNDENYFFDSLSLKEMDDALSEVTNENNFNFEFIGCDACLMANFSTAGLFSKYAKYMYGSEEIEPSGGWNYIAFLESISKNDSDGKQLGIDLCDGYYEKSLTSKRSAIATMACFDLSLFDELNSSFEKLSKELIRKSKSIKGLRQIAYAAKNAVKFGGTTETEGFSNLIDLGSFVEGISDLDCKEEFLDTLDRFVIYHKAGEQKLSTKGLSIYYPVDVDSSDLNEYTRICPCNSYGEFLKYNFTNIPKETIKFVDSGSINSNGEFSIELDSESMNYLLSVDFNLVEYDVDDSFDAIVQVSLGNDNDLSSTGEEKRRFNSNFRGVWNSLNGYKLYNHVVESSKDYIIFDSPIRINGNNSNLRYMFRYDDNYLTDGYYEILGAWNGIDMETGMSDKDFIELSLDDVVEVYYPYKVIALTPGGKVVSSEIFDRYVQIDNKDGFKISEDGLDGESYIYQYIITDIYGKKYYSNAGFMIMKEGKDLINSTVRVNGKYAGYASEVIRTDFKSIFDSNFIDSIVKFESVRDKIKDNRLYNKDNIWKSNIIKF